jgi:Ca2+/Na+ antiporter
MNRIIIIIALLLTVFIIGIGGSLISMIYGWGLMPKSFPIIIIVYIVVTVIITFIMEAIKKL